MPDKRYLKLEVFSRRPLTEDFARSQLELLINYKGGIFCPERCDVGEPLHENFDPENLKEPIRWVSQRGGQVTFKRNHSIRLLGYIKNELLAKIWTRESRRGPKVEYLPNALDPAFCTTWVVWIDAVVTKREPYGLLKNFLIEVFKVSKADYGFLTPEDDHKAKNYLVTAVDENTTSSEFVGDNLEKGLPGLYWMNLFGNLYVEWFGKGKFKRIKCHEAQFLDDSGVFLQFGASPEECMSAYVLQRQQEAIELLNPNAFFDITRPERKLETLDSSKLTIISS